MKGEGDPENCPEKKKKKKKNKEKEKKMQKKAIFSKMGQFSPIRFVWVVESRRGGGLASSLVITYLRSRVVG